MNATLIAGVALLVASLPYIGLLAIEIALSTTVHSRYEFGIDWNSNDVSLGSNQVLIRDEFYEQAFPADHDLRKDAPVQILVNGEDFGIDSPVNLRPGFKDRNRYHRWISTGTLDDTDDGVEYIFIGQRASPMRYEAGEFDGDFRILFVDPSGVVTEDRFTYHERSSPPLRAAIVAHLTPFPSGMRTNTFQVYPNPIFPLLYPILTFLASLPLIGAGLVVRKRRRIRRATEAERV